MANSFDIPPLRTATTQSVLDNRASEFARRMFDRIQKYDAELDTAYAVGLRLANFGQTVIIHIENIGYSNPSLISFIGKTDVGDPVELIQHVSQINLLLMRVSRDPNKPRESIGFHPALGEDQAE
jgi:hypothetical protein